MKREKFRHVAICACTPRPCTRVPLLAASGWGRGFGMVGGKESKGWMEERAKRRMRVLVCYENTGRRGQGLCKECIVHGVCTDEMTRGS